MFGISIRLAAATLMLALSSTLLAQNNHFSCGNSVLAEELALLIIESEDQRRGELQCDIELTKIAEVKAQHLMGEQSVEHNIKYLTPNQLLREFNYPLPKSYAYLGNQVESIAGGFAQADGVFDSLKKSATHKAHILGSNDFFSRQNKIGVAYVKNRNTKHEDYWVVLIAKDTPDAPRKMEVSFDNSSFLESLRSQRNKNKKNKLYNMRVKDSYKMADDSN